MTIPVNDQHPVLLAAAAHLANVAIDQIRHVRWQPDPLSNPQVRSLIVLIDTGQKYTFPENQVTQAIDSQASHVLVRTQLAPAPATSRPVGAKQAPSASPTKPKPQKPPAAHKRIGGPKVPPVSAAKKK